MSDTTKIRSYFLPAERASKKEIQHQVTRFKDDPSIGQLFNAVPDLILLLNKHRQIVFVNKSFLNFFGIKSETSIYGLRPGEVLDCIHCKEIQGCGTTEFCTVCGAANAIQYCQQGKKDCKE
jgi:PAS domain-containing protein